MTLPEKLFLDVSPARIAESSVHTDHFQNELMNSQIAVMRLSMSVGNRIQRNVSSFRNRSPTEDVCSPQREFPLTRQNESGIDLLNSPVTLRLEDSQGYTNSTESLFPCYQNYYMAWDRRRKLLSSCVGNLLK